MDEAIAMSMLILQELKETQCEKATKSTEKIVRELLDDVVYQVEKDSVSGFQTCNVETENTSQLGSLNIVSDDSLDLNDSFREGDYSEVNTESIDNNNSDSSSIKSELDSIKSFEFNENDLSTKNDAFPLNQEFTDYEELNSMFLEQKVNNVDEEEMPLVSEFPEQIDKHSLPETPSPDPMECEPVISMREEEPDILAKSNAMDISEKLNSDVRKSTRRTKGVNHHDFFPSDLLNFTYINSRIQKNISQSKPGAATKKLEEASFTKYVETNPSTSAHLCEPSTSLKKSTFIENISDSSALMNDLPKDQDFNDESYSKKIRGKKRKLVRKERNFVCENYIYRPDFDDCTEEELRKLYQYLKLRTKGFVRSQPQEIIIDNFPIQYFPSEASMKDCALFDAFDRVCTILAQRYPSVAKLPEPALPKPYTTNPNIIKLTPKIEPIPEITISPESDDTDMSDSSFEDFEDGSVPKKQKFQRPNFKIRGRNDIRKVSFEQALKEFKKPTSNGKYDGPVPVSILKQARDDKNFNGSVISKKVISLLEKIEAQPSKLKPKRQIFKPLDLKSNLAAYQKNKSNNQATSSSPYIPINRTISGSTNLMTVPQFYKKPSCKVTIRSSNIFGKKNYVIGEGTVRPQIIMQNKKVSPIIQSNNAPSNMKNSSPTQLSPTGKYPILKSAISGEYKLRPSIVGSEQTYKSVFSRPLSPTVSAPNIQRHSLLTASSFNPPPAVAARRRLQIIGSGAKAQVVEKTAPNVSVQSKSLLNGPKFTKILTSIPSNPPSFLKEIPRETYAKGSQVSLLQPPKIIQQRIHPQSSTPTTLLKTLTPDQNRVSTETKAAMANLTKPLILYSESPNSNKIFSSSLTTAVAGQRNNSPMKTYVRLTPSSTNSTGGIPTTSQYLVKKSLLNNTNVSSTTVPSVRNLPSGTSISIVKPAPPGTSSCPSSVTTITPVSSNNNQSTLLKHLTAPTTTSNSSTSNERSSLKLCYPNVQKIRIHNPHLPPSTSIEKQPVQNNVSTASENRTWLTPISGTKFAIQPTPIPTSTTITNQNSFVQKKFNSDNSQSLLSSNVPTMIAKNSVNLGIHKNGSLQRVTVKPISISTNNTTTSTLLSKLPEDNKSFLSSNSVMADDYSKLTSSNLFNKLAPKANFQFGGVVPTSTNIQTPKAFTLLAPPPNDVRKHPNIFFVNSKQNN